MAWVALVEEITCEFAELDGSAEALWRLAAACQVMHIGHLEYMREHNSRFYVRAAKKAYSLRPGNAERNRVRAREYARHPDVRKRNTEASKALLSTDDPERRGARLAQMREYTRAWRERKRAERAKG